VRRRSITFDFATLLLLFGLPGCAAPDSRTAYTTDSWWSPPPPDRNYVAELDSDRICPVNEAKEADAESRLAVQPVVELSEQEVGTFTEHMHQPREGTKAYLVRGYI
jgi:hypothetical protein